MNQRERVLGWLMQGPVCGTTLLAEMIPRYAARISELRRDGHVIGTRRCSNQQHHHQSRQVEYVLDTLRLW